MIETPAPGVAAVDRALAILAAFPAEGGALPLRELAARTGLYKSTILRLLASLERARCVERRANGDWAPGAMLFRWGEAWRRGLSLDGHVPTALRALADGTGESAGFWLAQGKQRLCAFRAESLRPVRFHVREGDLLPIAQGAGGRVLLAFAAGRGAGPPRCLASFGERDPETASVAAPVFGPQGALAGALALSGPRARIEGALPALEAAVLAAAEGLTRRLGGDLTPQTEQAA